MDKKKLLLLFTLAAAVLVLGAKSFQTNKLIFGSGQGADQTFEMNTGDGPGNPKIRWNESGQTFDFCNNGIDCAPFGSGSGAGGINYLTNGTFELNVDGVDAFADGAVSDPIDGTGGAPTLTCLQTTIAAEVLRGNGSLIISKDAADRQGEGCSLDFTVDPADLDKILGVFMDYSTTATNFVLGDVGAYVLCDVDNSGSGTFLTDVTAASDGSNDNLVNSTNGAKVPFLGSWVGPIDAADTDCRLIFMQKTTAALAYDLIIDNVQVGPGTIATGAVLTAWEPFIGDAQNLTTNIITSTAFRRRVGTNLEVSGTIEFDGTNIEGLIAPNIDGFTADTSKLHVFDSTSRDAVALGSWSLGSDGQGYYHGTVIIDISAGTIQLAWEGTGASGDRIVRSDTNTPVTIADGTTVSWNFSIPVTEYAGGGVVNLVTEDNLSKNKAYTPAGDYQSWTTSGETGIFHRVGENVHVSFGFTVDSASGGLLFVAIEVMPPGLTINEALLPGKSEGDRTVVGGWQAFDGATSYSGVVVYDRSANTFNLPFSEGTISTTGPVPASSSWGATSNFSVEFTVPVNEFRRAQNSLIGFTDANEKLGGLVTTNTQTFAGNKTFTGDLIVFPGNGVVNPEIIEANVTGSDIISSTAANLWEQSGTDSEIVLTNGTWLITWASYCRATGGGSCSIGVGVANGSSTLPNSQSAHLGSVNPIEGTLNNSFIQVIGAGPTTIEFYLRCSSAVGGDCIMMGDNISGVLTNPDVSTYLRAMRLKN